MASKLFNRIMDGYEEIAEILGLSDDVKNYIKAERASVDSNKKTNKNTNESLNEEGENNMENVENMTPEQNGISSMLSDMIVDEWETIDKYNSVIASLPKTGEYEDIKNVINDIIKEEYMHVGQLESAIKTVDDIANHIEKGEMEGDLQLDESIEEEAKFTLDESLFEE